MKKKVGTLLAGATIGAALGLFFAPREGEKTRKMAKEKLEDLKKKALDIDYNEVKENTLEKIEELKNDLKDLDKEKALELAKEKGEELKEKIEDLAKKTKEKATPTIEATIEDLRKSAIKTTKEITKKLEASKKADK